MKLSYNWLGDFLDLSETDVNTVAERLTMGAFEVEEIEKIGDKLEGRVVLGEIREIVKHPDADKLQITQTCIGYKEENGQKIEDVQQIVCGARNIAVGQRIPVATVASKVFNRHDGSALEIKKSKIRGVESCGMLCSPDELGYSEEESKKIKEAQGDGIYILQDLNQGIEIAKDFLIGDDIREVLAFSVDHVLEVGARSNRGDALSVLGQSREVAALLAKEISFQQLKSLQDLEARCKFQFKIDKNIKSIDPIITDSKDCSVFYTVAVENIQIAESPQWLKNRIEAMGMRSINNLVDISNYVMLELGQPMHFYDRDKLQGNALAVRRAKASPQGLTSTSVEQIKTLDDNEYRLNEINLLITDHGPGLDLPVAIAGVMGGFDTQITDATKSIIVECAAFSPASVRRSARAAGVESESKRRFERGVDKAMTQAAMLRALELIIELHAGLRGGSDSGITVGEVLVAGSSELQELKVTLALTELHRHLGIDIAADKIIELLRPLELECKTNVNEQTRELEFSIPSFRQLDVYRDIDLIEEIGRLYGFDQIPVTPPASSVAANARSVREDLGKQITSAFVSYGFSQAILSSLVGETLINVSLEKKERNDTQIAMLNPLSKEHSVLRQSLIPGLIKAASRNYSYDRSQNIKLFEHAKVYFSSKVIADNPSEIKTQFLQENSFAEDTASIEQERLAAIMLSSNHSWKQAKPESEDFFNLKAVVAELYPRAIFKSIQDAEAEKGGRDLEPNPSVLIKDFAHPGISAVIFEDNRRIGYIAKLHPSLSADWNLPDNVYIFEALVPKQQKNKFIPVASTPISERDITVDAPVLLSSDALIDCMQKSMSKPLLKDLSSIKLISLYQASDSAESKSLSYRLKWQSQTETLSGDLIDAEVLVIKEALKNKLGVEFRA